ncbi:MAG: hypothetical protein K6B75_02700, partial [Lachnospiraceae bacterium]|nr:hypothetical protein [Lachnospiraceae bacterium]
MGKEEVKEEVTKVKAKKNAEPEVAEENTNESKDECRERIDAFKKEYVSCETLEQMLEICGRIFESLNEYKTEKDIRQYIELWAYMEARAGLISDEAIEILNNAFYGALKEKFVWLYRNGKPELAWKLNERCFKFFDQYFYNLNSDENFFFQLMLVYYLFVWSKKLESGELFTSMAESCYRYYRSNKRRLLKNPENGAAQNLGRFTAKYASNTVLNLQETDGLMFLIDYLKGTFNKSSGTD